MADEANPNQVRENEPADLGYAPPDTGQGEVSETDVPEGVESLSEEQKQAAEERGGGGGDEGGDEGALDVSAIVQDDDSGDADADEAGDADDADDDTTAKTDEEAQSEPDTGEAG
jgi:hypothetical protein